MAHPKVQAMLDLAALDVKKMRVANTCRSAREAWISFLENSNRAINRLEGYSKSTGQHDKYLNLIRKEVWASDLTKFMRTARNAHEHGVVDTEIDDPFNERVKYPNGFIMGAMTIIAKNEAGEEVYLTPSAPMQLSPGPGQRVRLRPTIRLVAVKSPRGEILRPPHITILETDDEPECHAVARMYLKWVIEQISGFA